MLGLTIQFHSFLQMLVKQGVIYKKKFIYQIEVVGAVQTLLFSIGLISFPTWNRDLIMGMSKMIRWICTRDIVKKAFSFVDLFALWGNYQGFWDLLFDPYLLESLGESDHVSK